MFGFCAKNKFFFCAVHWGQFVFVALLVFLCMCSLSRLFWSGFLV